MTDPVLDNPTLFMILNTYLKAKGYSTDFYRSSKEAKDCADFDIMTKNKTGNDTKIEIKVRHYANKDLNRMLTSANYFSEDDVLVEDVQYADSPRSGWLHHCKADRLLYIKVLYKNNIMIDPMTCTVEDIRKVAFLDINWPALKTVVKFGEYSTRYCGNTTGSTNFVVPYSDIPEYNINMVEFKHS